MNLNESLHKRLINHRRFSCEKGDEMHLKKGKFKKCAESPCVQSNTWAKIGHTGVEKIRGSSYSYL